MGDWTDSMVATAVRMLMRDQLDHEVICVLGRDRIMSLSAERDRLRAELASATECNLRQADTIHRQRKECREALAKLGEASIRLDGSRLEVQIALAERDAAEDAIAWLREALERIDREMVTISDGKQEEIRNDLTAGDAYGWKDAHEHVQRIITAALARMPAQHRARIVAAGLRELAEKMRAMDMDIGAEIADAEAERLERGG